MTTTILTHAAILGLGMLIGILLESESGKSTFPFWASITVFFTPILLLIGMQLS